MHSPSLTWEYNPLNALALFFLGVQVAQDQYVKSENNIIFIYTNIRQVYQVFNKMWNIYTITD